MADFKTHLISSGSALPLYVRDYDDGQHGSRTVLCLSGLTRNSKDFHKLAMAHKERYRFLCLDYRGRGQSGYDPEWRNYTPATYLGDIHHVLTALNIHEIAVIGTSLGGILAMAMGVTMPSSLRGVLLNDVSPDLPLESLSGIIDYMQHPKTFDTWDQVASFLMQTFPDLPADDQQGWLDIAKATYKEREDGRLVPDWDVNIVKPLLSPSAQPINLWPFYQSLKKLPVLSVRGALSSFVGEQTLAKMLAAIPTLSTVQISDVGHAPTLTEAPSQIAISQWLENCFDQ